MSKKTVLVIILILILVMLLASCSVLENDYTTTSTTASTTTTIKTTTESTTRIVYDVPYEGMLASQINNTKLGNATEVKKCTDFYKLRASHRTTDYIWKKNGVTIFKATVRYWDYKNKRATSGYVSNVADLRQYETYTYRSSTTKKKTTTTDPYNAKDYKNEDDFYEDHYDDFFDYEDAEDYYRDHQ